ncbi:MAG: hypothetical protein WCE30_03215 [Mycobacterium sp.]
MEFYRKHGRYELNGEMPVVAVSVSGTFGGHTVSLRRQLPDGRIAVDFVGPPVVAREHGFDGDRYVGWTGLVAPNELKDIQVVEIRRV